MAAHDKYIVISRVIYRYALRLSINHRISIAISSPALEQQIHDGESSKMRAHGGVSSRRARFLTSTRATQEKAAKSRRLSIHQAHAREPSAYGL